jgi:fatty-acid desaturase
MHVVLLAKLVSIISKLVRILAKRVRILTTFVRIPTTLVRILTPLVKNQTTFVRILTTLVKNVTVRAYVHRCQVPDAWKTMSVLYLELPDQTPSSKNWPSEVTAATVALQQQ